MKSFALICECLDLRFHIRDTHEDFHLTIQSIVHDQAVCESHAVLLHRMACCVGKITNILIVEVVNSLFYTHLLTLGFNRWITHGGCHDVLLGLFEEVKLILSVHKCDISALRVSVRVSES
jgi:hypothetical protein